MAKELIYLQTGELRSQGSFIGRVEELIQIPVNHKTKVKDVFHYFEMNYANDSETWNAMEKCFDSLFDGKGTSKWYDTIDIIPEEGIQLYVIFNLRTI